MGSIDPFFVENLAGTPCVAFADPNWESDQTVPIAHSRDGYYTVVLDRIDRDMERMYPGVRFWSFSRPVFYPSDDRGPMPWEMATRKQVEFIARLLRTKKFERTATGIKHGSQEATVNPDRLEELTKKQASHLIFILKECRNRIPDGPTFAGIELDSKKRKTWMIAGAPTDAKEGDKIAVTKRDGEVRHVVLTTKHAFKGNKSYWEFEDNYDTYNDVDDEEFRLAEQAAVLYRRVLTYHLDDEDEENENHPPF